MGPCFQNFKNFRGNPRFREAEWGRTNERKHILKREWGKKKHQVGILFSFSHPVGKAGGIPDIIVVRTR